MMPRQNNRFAHPDSTRRGLRAATLLLVLLGSFGLLTGALPGFAQQDGPPRPCEDDPLHRQLDFWVGDWQVVGSDGERLGTNRVRRLHGGCVIEENWSSGGSDLTGQSMNYVDPRDGRWKQTWVDSSGSLVVYDGAFRGGAMHFEGENVRPDGSAVQARVVVEPAGEDRVHHRIDHSSDGGETWEVVFDATYVSLEEEPPAPAPSPAPAAEPQPEPAAAPAREPAPEVPEPAAAPEGRDEVRASSGVVPEKEVPLGERNRIFLESPMVLEVPIGPIESIPEEYSWSTDETSVYVCDGVSVRRVALSRNERGGTVEVEVVPALYCSGYLQHVDVAAEVVWRGEVLGSAAVEDLSVGRSVAAQNEGPGLEKRLTLEVDRDRFEEAFGGQKERPVLKLTVTVRD